MRPLFVINNFGQFNHLILRMLRDLGIEARMVPNSTPPGTLAVECRGIILGGGPISEGRGTAVNTSVLASRSSGSVSATTSSPRPSEARSAREKQEVTGLWMSGYPNMTLSFPVTRRQSMSGHPMQMK